MPASRIRLTRWSPMVMAVQSTGLCRSMVALRRVGRTAGAQKCQRIGSEIPDLLSDTGRYPNRIAGPDLTRFISHGNEPASREDVINLIGAVQPVPHRLRARRHRRVGQTDRSNARVGPIDQQPDLGQIAAPTNGSASLALRTNMAFKLHPGGSDLLSPGTNCRRPLDPKIARSVKPEGKGV